MSFSPCDRTRDARHLSIVRGGSVSPLLTTLDTGITPGQGPLPDPEFLLLGWLTRYLYVRRTRGDVQSPVHKNEQGMG